MPRDMSGGYIVLAFTHAYSGRIATLEGACGSDKSKLEGVHKHTKFVKQLLRPFARRTLVQTASSLLGRHSDAVCMA